MKDTDEERPRRVAALVREVIDAAPVIDMHTHLFPTELGAKPVPLRGWISCSRTITWSRSSSRDRGQTTPEALLRLAAGCGRPISSPLGTSLFVRGTPVSEATSGVVAVLERARARPRARPIPVEARAFFARPVSREAHVDCVLAMCSASRRVVMTNDPSIPRGVGGPGLGRAPPSISRFRAALRLDVLLNEWLGAPLIRARPARIPVATDSERQIRRRGAALPRGVDHPPRAAYGAGPAPRPIFDWQKTSARHRLLTRGCSPGVPGARDAARADARRAAAGEPAAPGSAGDSLRGRADSRALRAASATELHRETASW